MDSAQKTNNNTSDRPSCLELANSSSQLEAIKPQELQQILEQLKNSPSLQNSFLNFNRSSPISMNNLNTQQFIGLYPNLSSANSPQVTSAASPATSLVYLAHSNSGTSNANPPTPGQVIVDATNNLQTIPMSVNLCSPITLTSSPAHQPSSLPSFTPNNCANQAEVLQPVLLQTPASMNVTNGGQTAATGTKSKMHTERSDHTQIQRLERKRAKNRDAAKKCRERKLSLINSLQGYVQQLINDNKTLRSLVETEREEVKRLKSFVVDHMEKECDFILEISGNSSQADADLKSLPSKKRKSAE